MELRPEVFSRLYVNIVRAGETGGILDQLLQDLAGFLETAEETRKQVISAMTYPLSYGDLKTMIRNSLEYAFVPGDSLWRQTRPYQLRDECQKPRALICQAFLAKSSRARLQMTLEEQFAQFEAATPKLKH